MLPSPDKAAPAGVNVLRFLAGRYALVIPAFVAMSSTVFYWSVRHQYLRDWERHAVDAATDLNQDLLLGLADGSGVAPPPSRWSAAGLMPRIDGLTRRYLRQVDVARINIFDAGGRVVFSTRAGLAGRGSRGNRKLDRALAGEAVSDLERARDPADFPDAGHARDLLETYVPMRALDGRGQPTGPIVGAFEVYQDVAAMYRGLAMLRDVVLLGSVGILVVLAAILAAVGRQVDGEIRRERGARRRLEQELHRTVDDLERTVAERTAQVRREQHTLATVLDAAPTAFVMLDGEARVVYASRRFCELAGVPAARTRGLPCRDLWPDGAVCVRCAARAALAERRQCTTLQSRSANGGGVRWFEHVAVPVDRGEQGAGVLEMITDVTERRLAEEHFARAARLATAGEIAAAVAHEVRNAATTTRLFLQLAAERPGRAEREARTLDAALMSVSRMEALVENLLRLARPADPDLAPLDAGALVRGAVDLVRPEAQRRGVRMVGPGGDAGGPAHGCTGDRALLTEALVNLLLNALQSFDGAAPGAPREVAVEVTAAGGRVEIRIRDTGPGLRDEDPARLFEPFFTTKPGGTGLGLPIARRVFARHGGTLDLAPAPGGGTVVRATLSAAPAAASGPAGEEAG